MHGISSGTGTRVQNSDDGVGQPQAPKRNTNRSTANLNRFHTQVDSFNDGRGGHVRGNRHGRRDQGGDRHPAQAVNDQWSTRGNGRRQGGRGRLAHVAGSPHDHGACRASGNRFASLDSGSDKFNPASSWAEPPRVRNRMQSPQDLMPMPKLVPVPAPAPLTAKVQLPAPVPVPVPVKVPVKVPLPLPRASVAGGPRETTPQKSVDAMAPCPVSGDIASDDSDPDEPGLSGKSPPLLAPREPRVHFWSAMRRLLPDPGEPETARPSLAARLLSIDEPDRPLFTALFDKILKKGLMDPPDLTHCEPVPGCRILTSGRREVDDFYAAHAWRKLQDRMVAKQEQAALAERLAKLPSPADVLAFLKPESIPRFVELYNELMNDTYFHSPNLEHKTVLDCDLLTTRSPDLDNQIAENAFVRLRIECLKAGAKKTSF